MHSWFREKGVDLSVPSFAMTVKNSCLSSPGQPHLVGRRVGD